VTKPHVRRRDFLAAAAGLTLVAPARAVAADRDPELLLELFAREDAAATAYRGRAEPLPGLTSQAADHVAALRTTLDGFGRTPKPAPLDAPAARYAEDGELDAAIALEASLVEAYSAAVVDLVAAGALQTAASILASHVENQARLSSRAGRDPFRALSTGA
jgi:Ferritin-like domain